ncbi:hypothetical protein K0B96_05610 [Horticoccus luteus]|uniref:Tetratricopeptide repeat protein n=1 Tax=Horticoccus luteus TaxID=2862869 RepID=A0A8F9XHB5_9BACT|nr:tetratricopeptide repeat protein [Horticoccus luteus]QYM80092.1 hypothetical protein K0B96_05610 [Horticoccus luteus]
MLGATAWSQSQAEREGMRLVQEAQSTGDTTQALRLLDAMVQDSPALASAYSQRARARWAAGDKPGAIEDLGRVIQLNPELKSTYALRARWRRDNGDYVGAIEDAGKAGEFPENVETRGEARLALGRYQEALEDFKYLRSGRFGPYTRARYPQAVCLMALGETAEAVQWFKADYDDGGRIDARACMNLGYCLLGQYADAEKDLSAWVAAGAAKTVDESDYDRAVRESLRESVDNAQYLLGVVRFAQEDFDGAAAAMAKVPATSSFHDYAQLWRYLAKLRGKRAEELAKAWADFRDPWAAQLGAFLRAEIDEKKLFAAAAESEDAAERRAREGEAAFYAAQKRIIAGDAMAATWLFEKAVATGSVESVEYTLAKIALRPKRTVSVNGSL